MVSVTPYYDDGSCVIYHGRCEDVLPSLPQVDLVFTSPPYNLGRTSGAYANMRDGYDEHDDAMPDKEYIAWQKRVLDLLWRRLSPTGAIFYNHKPIQREGRVLLPTRLLPGNVELRQVIVWDRGVGMNWSASHFCPQQEWILLLGRPQFRLRSRGASSPGDVWTVPIEQDRGVDHPCAFPLALPARAIEATGPSVVLDPFLGSGTTLRAAKDAGVRGIGIEISERYCEIAAKRLAQEVLAFG